MRANILFLATCFASVSCAQPVKAEGDYIFRVASLLHAVRNAPDSASKYLSSGTKIWARGAFSGDQKGLHAYTSKCQVLDLNNDSGDSRIVTAKMECQVDKLEGIKVQGGAVLIEKRTLKALFNDDKLSDVWLGEHQIQNDTEVPQPPPLSRPSGSNSNG